MAKVIQARTLYDDLEELLDDQDQYAQLSHRQQEQPQQQFDDQGNPLPKKKKKRNKKKKKQPNAGDVNNPSQQNGTKDTGEFSGQRLNEQIAMDSTPLKYKLGASFYEDSDSSEDEGLADYKIGGYHPMHVGEILIERYVIIQKLGWGHFSTVWLAKDIYYNTYVALKIQRSAPHYLEAAFDEVEILDQVSSNWVKPEWLDSLKQYYKEHPEKLKKITANDCYSVQLLNCLIHHGPHGKHFVMVFEILGVNLLEVIKRYNYKGAPLPIVRQMAKQCLMGLDYLHRVCKIIHTDLKPENVNLCLTEKEVQEIATRGQLTTTKMYHQPEEIKMLSCAARLDPKSFRGRKNEQDNGEQNDERQTKRAQKKKRQRERKKQKKQLMNQDNILQTEEAEGTVERDDLNNPLTTERDYETLERDNETISPSGHQKNNLQSDNLGGNQQDKKKRKKKKKGLQLNNKNENKHQQQSDATVKPQLERKQSEVIKTEFSLKHLGPDQIKEVNEMLEQYMEVPKALSLPRQKFIPTPDDLSPENEEEFEFLMSEFYKGSRYAYDTEEYEHYKSNLEQFQLLRRKFEQSQRALLGKGEVQKSNSKGQVPKLNLQDLDPREMQQQIEEDKAKKRGPKLDENLRLKICDLGNGCWTYHHFSTEIQTRQYRSPEVIIGAKYGASADIWSFACMIFEMATGDFLFEPRKGKTYGKDDDHLAQMMELIGRMPRNMALGGRKSKKFFDSTGHLRKIRGLNYWPLKKVLVEKYRFKEEEALMFADFLTPMLTWDPDQRVSAEHMLSHPWLSMSSNYDTKMSDQELQQHLERQAKLKELEEPGEEMSKLEEEQPELNAGDIEDNDRSFYSDLEDDTENPFFEDEQQDNQMQNPKQYRDIAEGKNLNNSFVGPYPENWDHLHIDKGANPQFMRGKEKQENSVFSLAEKYGLIK